MENRYDKDYKDNEINNYYENNELGFKKEVANLGNVSDLLCKFVNQSRKILKDNLVGIYLHGSAVMGCFNPQKSDIDLIIVVKDTMSDKAKRAYMDMLIELNGKEAKKGIEPVHSIYMSEIILSFITSLQILRIIYNVFYDNKFMLVFL